MVLGVEGHERQGWILVHDVGVQDGAVPVAHRLRLGGLEDVVGELGLGHLGLLWPAQAAVNVMVISPMTSAWVTSQSPGRSTTLGSRAHPIPAGVPVKIRSPASNGTTADSDSIRCGTVKIR